MKKTLVLLLVLCVLLTALTGYTEGLVPVGPESVDTPVPEVEYSLGQDEAAEELPLPTDGDRTMSAEEEAEAVADEADDVPLDEAHFPDAGFRAYISAGWDKNQDSVLSKDEIKALDKLSIKKQEGQYSRPEYDNISTLKGIEYLTYIEQIDIEGNDGLTQVDLSGRPYLNSFTMKNCSRLLEVRLNNCSYLETVDCRHNSQLTTFVINDCSWLTKMLCYDNKLSVLDFNGCYSITELDCGMNELTYLDISGYAKLYALYCPENRITSLKVDGCPELRMLFSSDNQLCELKIHNCPKLYELLCHRNQLVSLDVSQCPALHRLWCFGNQITELDISQCPILCKAVETATEHWDDFLGYPVVEYYTSSKKDSLMIDPDVTLLLEPSATPTPTPTLTPTLTTTPTLTPTPAPTPKLTATLVTINVGETHKLLADDSPVGAADCVFTSSNANVATVSADGVVTGVGPGKSTVSVKTDAANLAVSVTVKENPTKITLSQTEATMGTGDQLTLKATLSNSVNSAKLTWTCSNEKVAKVSKKGVVTAIKKGKATIKVSTDTGASAECKLVVKKGPSKVTLNKEKLELEIGDTFDLKASLPLGSFTSSYTWKSSNKKVATVSDYFTKGKVVALKEGKTTITVTTGNNKSASCVVAVKNDPVKYRALLIGQSKAVPAYKRHARDADKMESALKKVHGPEGGKYEITKKYNLSHDETLKAISDTFYGANANDVSLFFISTHGVVHVERGKEAGELAMVPATPGLMMGELAAALKRVPGKVIVILQSCGSGAGIYVSTEEENANEISANDLRTFDAAAISAFADIDTGIMIDEKGHGVDETDPLYNTGELRLSNKFYVLTAAAHQQRSWGISTGNSFFVTWLTNGMGTRGKMPADTDSDGLTTLNEMFKYISKVGDHYDIQTEEGILHQHVQVYPKNSNYALFKR